MSMDTIIESYYKDNAKKLHIMVDKILFKLKFNVDNEDFYSLANEIFLRVLKDYDGERSFDGFLYSCLEKKFKTEMTRRGRKKRKADKESISIDSLIGDDEKLKISDVIADKDTVEKIVFGENEETYSNEMQEYLNRLSSMQKEVLRLMSIGFEQSEVLAELHITKKQYENCYAAIHSYRNISILM